MEFLTKICSLNMGNSVSLSIYLNMYEHEKLQNKDTGDNKRFTVLHLKTL